MWKILSFVKRSFNNHPIIINSLVYGTLYVGAEFSQQTMSKKVLANAPEPYDVPVFGRYAVFGTSIGGPLLTVWYKWLDKKFVGHTYKVITRKLLLDQFLMTPPLYVLFYVSMSFMERKDDLLEECQRKFLPTFKTSCLFWLPAQTVNFLLIPPAFRVIYVGSCSFIWVNMLCYIKRQQY